jgi:hypothetical protein
VVLEFFKLDIRVIFDVSLQETRSRLETQNKPAGSQKLTFRIIGDFGFYLRIFI